MKDDYTIAWSWLTPEQQAALRQNPAGPVPPGLVPRLQQIGLLGVGTQYKTHRVTGERRAYLPPDLVSFIEAQPV
ncbi:hypothetical protein [Rhodococcus sp. JS3073]|uniref:hypothetical protein n=1 Tax=Rhodococcus sp. JS3073 TaxID=3002901 RepID=UPI002285F9DF|nr:hypothetical protein [Rhodococcus sp. JS3073]WAM13942.1 hypothetical protein OYT95_31650 [Rhodococcus sp. JS3073]